MRLTFRELSFEQMSFVTVAVRVRYQLILKLHVLLLNRRFCKITPAARVISRVGRPRGTFKLVLLVNIVATSFLLAVSHSRACPACLSVAIETGGI